MDIFRTLSRILEICDQLRDEQQLFKAVYVRLSDIMTQIDKIESRPGSDLLEKYVDLADRILVFFDAYNRKPILNRMFSRRKLLSKLQEYHNDIDVLFKVFHLAMGDEMMNWKARYLQDRRQHMEYMKSMASNTAVMMRELSDQRRQLEALTVLKYELSARSTVPVSESSSEQIEEANENIAIMRAAFNTVARSSTAKPEARNPEWFLHDEQIEVGERIAQGSFGSVHRASWGIGAEVIVKKLLDGTERSRKMFRKEIETWWKINRHPNVLKMYGACHVSEYPFIVCEYAKYGNLDDFLADDANMNRHLWTLLHQAALGLHYLHSNGIDQVVHGDLKCNNILVGADMQAKLSDFGFSFIRARSSGMSAKAQTGADRWKAPECLIGGNPTPLSDVFAFGMCILEAVTGEVPWASVLDDGNVRSNVLDGRLPPRPPIKSYPFMTIEAWDLITGMCRREPSTRLTLPIVIQRLKQLAEEQAKQGRETVDRTICRSCGSDQLSSAKFCGECGQLLAEVAFKTERVKRLAIEDMSVIQLREVLRETPPNKERTMMKILHRLHKFADTVDGVVDIYHEGLIRDIAELASSEAAVVKKDAILLLAKLADISRVEISPTKVFDQQLHEHSLWLRDREDHRCGCCQKAIEGRAYRCDDQTCDFDLCLECTFKKRGVESNSQLLRTGIVSKEIINGYGTNKLLLALKDENIAEDCLSLLKSLCWENKKVKQSLVKAGLLQAISEVIKSKDSSKQAKKWSAAVMASALREEGIKVNVGSMSVVEPLVQLLGGGYDMETRIWAAGALAFLAPASSDNEVLDEIASAHGIRMLVPLLQNPSWYPARAIAQLASKPTLRDCIVEEGAIRPLVQLLTAGTDTAKEIAASALSWLAKQENLHNQLVAEGAIGPLTQLLATGTASAKNHAAYTLSLMANQENLRDRITDEGAIRPLAQLLTTGTDTAKTNAAYTLSELAKQEHLRDGIAAEGAIRPLTQLLTTGTDAAKTNAAYTLSELAKEDNLRERIVDEGAIRPLVQLLTTGTDSAKNNAAYALSELAEQENLRDQIADEGGIRPLVQLLTNGTDTTKNNAACTLSELAKQKSLRDRIAAEGAIHSLAQLLTTGTETAKNNAACTLSELAKQESLRDQIAAEGSFRPLAQLMATSTDTAKSKPFQVSWRKFFLAQTYG